ncbi:MAG: amino acid ABC transporter permease [Anaerolineales bacterium]
MTASAPWTAAPMERPPLATVGAVGWLRKNLFSTWWNSAITVLTAALVLGVAVPSARWAATEANWAVITRNLGVFAWGRYPVAQAWRTGVSLLLAVALAGLTWQAWRQPPSRLRRWVLVGWLITPAIVALLLYGFSLPTPATILNNLGYYLFRPDVLLLLGEIWRAPMTLGLIAFLAGSTWGIVKERRGRALSATAVILVTAVSLPLGISAAMNVFGIQIPIVGGLLLIIAAAAAAGHRLGRTLNNVPSARRGLAIAWAAALPAAVLLLTHFDVGVERVRPAQVLPLVQPALWGGVLLTLVLATVSILASFPIGVLLALGRRSRLPVVRTGCVLFIEVVRGVPLISILFMAQVMLPLFLPLDWSLDRVIRAMAGMTLFTAAYLAEIVRGGLQAVRHEQVEAARALGLNELLVTLLVVLPQALRAVIPAIMGQSVSIFKDTSLVAIVGLFDLLAVGQSVTKQRDFIGAVREVYIVAGVFYFVISYGMSVASRRLEKRLGVDAS